VVLLSRLNPLYSLFCSSLFASTSVVVVARVPVPLLFLGIDSPKCARTAHTKREAVVMKKEKRKQREEQKLRRLEFIVTTPLAISDFLKGFPSFVPFCPLLR
jgi:hypothetical protein